MIRTDYVTVVCPAGGENVAQALVGTAAITRHILRVMIAPTLNVALVVYFDTDRYALVDSNILPALDPWVDVDADLPEGVALNIGLRDLLAVAPTMNIIYQWRE